MKIIGYDLNNKHNDKYISHVKFIVDGIKEKISVSTDKEVTRDYMDKLIE